LKLQKPKKSLKISDLMCFRWSLDNLEPFRSRYWAL